MQLAVRNHIDEIVEEIVTTVDYRTRLDIIRTALISIKSRFTGNVLRDVIAYIQKRIGPYRPQVTIEEFYTLTVEISDRVRIKVVNDKRKQLLMADLGYIVPQYTEYSVQQIDNELMVQYFNYGQLRIRHTELDEGKRMLRKSFLGLMLNTFFVNLEYFVEPEYVLCRKGEQDLREILIGICSAEI